MLEKRNRVIEGGCSSILSSLKTGQKIANRLKINEFTHDNSAQVVLALDLTGSMFSLHEAAIAELSNIAEQLEKLASGKKIEMAFFGYRNHGDESNYERIIESFGFDTASNIVQEMKRVKRGGGGPDGLTCLECVLKEINSLPWEQNSVKFVLLVGDMPPHGILERGDTGCPFGVDYLEYLAKIAAQNIRIYAVYCNTWQRENKIEQEKVINCYRNFAERTGGKFFGLEQISELRNEFSFLFTAVTAQAVGNFEWLHKKTTSPTLSPTKQKILKALSAE